jgi:hypothetical protein
MGEAFCGARPFFPQFGDLLRASKKAAELADGELVSVE